MTPPRIGLIGARRRRQGLGPFVARFLQDAGADVVCFYGTSTASVEAARAGLAERGVTALGYTDADAMFAEQALDGLAILSPAGKHRRWLDAALEHGLHTLCEKPFLWGADDDLAAAERIVAAFDARGLVLRENCQWPHTLPACFALHPGRADAPPRTFAMRMTPASRGADMIVDSASHPLSVLQALVPGDEPTLEDVRLSTHDADADELRLRFGYVSDDSRVETEILLAHGDREPREAGYSLDGAWARRQVRLPEYALSFTDGERSVPLPDPLAALVAEFVAAVAHPDDGQSRIQTRRIVPRLAALQRLVRAFRDPP